MTPIDPSLEIAAVELAVSDLGRSSDFYERVLGLPLRAREHGRAMLGGEAARPALVLTALDDPLPAPAGSTGLFHVAWLHPSRRELAATVRRAAAGGWKFDGASDHGVSEALYLSDPDGLGVEIYADRPRELWERPAGGTGVRMTTLPLDLPDLLAQHPEDPPASTAPETGVGHVHLRVADVDRAESFYREKLGFGLQARIPSASFLAAGDYHHHVGLNSWESLGGSPPPPGAPGLRLVEFALAGDEGLAALEDGLHRGQGHRDGERLLVSDPDGQLLSFAAGAGRRAS